MKWRHEHGGKSKLPRFDPLESEQLICDILEMARRSLHQQDLDSMIIFQLNMK